MSKINILPASVYNRIAAGEVVERPYSVVKELVENSIDAGATEIEIYVEQGGKQLIRIVDNGSGIEREDLQAAFLPHATSKLATAEDLRSIMTLGFRGEAVASIASVSNMTITSKTATGKCYQLNCKGGEMGRIIETAGENGTEVKVETLFFNIPARYSFMKTEKAEETDITTVVSRFILCNSNIAFTYYVNGKKVLQSFGGGDEEAIVGVYGPSVLSNCYKIDAVRNGIRVHGYIGNQNFFKANKSYQSLFLNGRYIFNATIASAVMGAYQSYLMKRQYPFYVLHMDVPVECVDVNVHPNKTDVRFSDNRVIYSTIYSIISSVLDGNSKALEYVVETPAVESVPQKTETPILNESMNMPTAQKTISERILETAQETQEKPLAVKDDIFAEQPKSKPSKYGFSTMTYEEAQKELEAFRVQQEQKLKERRAPITQEEFERGFIPAESIGEFTGKYSDVDPTNEAVLKKFAKRKNPEKLHKKHPDVFFERNLMIINDPDYVAQSSTEGQDFFAENKRYLEELDLKNKQNKIDVESCVYAGKLFNTYLLYERGNDVFVIDQHAAHERLIFNRLKENIRARNILQQPMLLPYEMKLNAFEGDFIRERMTDICEMGFSIEESSENCFKVTAIPLDLQKIDLCAFFNDILSDVNGYRAIRLEEILKDKLASAACKAAVKGGMDISREEIDALFALMDGDMGLKCPHGRPVVVKITRTELEKMFKRIV